MSETLAGVAPAEQLRADFEQVSARDTLRTTWTNEQLLLQQAVQGRAHEGWGSFNGHRYPNTTLDDVTRALRLDPAAVQAERQKLIDDIHEYVALTIAGTPPPYLLNADNEPLLGMGTLRTLKVEAADVLRGLYLGGLRDDADTRYAVEKRTGVPMGGGKNFYIDRQAMLRAGIDGRQLAHGEWAEHIERLRADGVIIGEERKDEPDIFYQFVRYGRGPGASDDAAIVAAGLEWGPGAAVGVFFADAIDTLEKSVPRALDQDEQIAGHIERDFADLKLTRDDVLQLTFWAAAIGGDGYHVPDSSLRHLLRVDRTHDLCAIESHLLTTMDVPCPPLGLDHERSESPQFYAWLRERMKARIPVATT